MKTTRRHVVGFAVLTAVVAVGLYWGLRSRPGADRPATRAVRHSSDVIDDVPAIGLDRLNAAERAAQDEAADADGGAAYAPPRVVPPGPAVPPAGVGPETAGPTRGSAPPMNVRFLGAVEAREGVWVAALLTDHKELLTGKEGDIVGNRYRIVKIGIESIDLVDVTSGRQRRVRLGGA